MQGLLSKAREDLERSVTDPHFSDLWSDAASRVYFDAAGFHGLEVEPDNVPDIYSYAFEALDALEKLGPVWDEPEPLAAACRDWHEGRLSRSRFLERVTELCQKEERVEP